jgi:uncharacterized peroxidase-related enzyme
MNALPLIERENVTGQTGELLDALNRNLGVIPNMAKAMANSPALLNGYVQLSTALSKGVIKAATRERIALAIAQDNACDYCLSAHSYLAEHAAKLDAADIAAARRSGNDDPKIAGILAFATAVNTSRGGVTSTDLEAAKAAGLTDEEIAETVGHVTINVLTNYFNKAAGVEIDFPVVTA